LGVLGGFKRGFENNPWAILNVTVSQTPLGQVLLVVILGLPKGFGRHDLRNNVSGKKLPGFFFGSLRGFFPGFAYQIGVLIASTIVYLEAVLAQYVSYSTSMEILAGSVLVLAAIVILAGPEAKGINFQQKE